MKDKYKDHDYKFNKSAEMSFAEVFDFAFKKHLIPILTNLKGIIDNNFVEMLASAADNAAVERAKK